jgi:tetratricopeptide (TPR) repeat protein
MLGTIREYALERFEALPDADAVVDRYVLHFFALAQAAEQHLAGPEQEQWVGRLAADYPDVRTALVRAAEVAPDVELAFALALNRFWHLRLHLAEGRRSLAGALERARDAPAAQRAYAHYRLGDLAFDEGDYEEARARFEESLDLYRAEGDDQYAAFCLNGLAILAQQENRVREARELFDEAIATAREAGDATHAAGFAGNLGLLEVEEGNDLRAAELFRESLAEYRKSGEKEGAGYALQNLGFVALRGSRLDEASELLLQALDEAGRSAASRLALFSLVGHAAVASARGDAVRAARLLGAVGALCEETHLTLELQEADTDAHTRAAARAELGDDAFAAAWEEGTAMGLDEAIEYALAAID